MKTLIINGSPRKSGDVSALLAVFENNLKGEIKKFSPFYDDISPCTDCRYCRTHTGICGINDKMQEIYDCTTNFDNIIIATPVYFLLPTGPLLNVLSRFQVYFSKGWPSVGKPKKGAVVITAGGSGGVKETEKVIHTMLRVMNAVSVGTVAAYNTDKVPAEEDEKALRKAEEIASLLSYEMDR